MIHIDLTRVGAPGSTASGGPGSKAAAASARADLSPHAPSKSARHALPPTESVGGAVGGTARPTVGVSAASLAPPLSLQSRGRRASAAPSQTTQTTRSSGGSVTSGSASARAAGVAAPWSAPRMFRDDSLLDARQVAQRYAGGYAGAGSASGGSAPASGAASTAGGLETTTVTPRETISGRASSSDDHDLLDAAAADRAQRIADGVAAARAASAAKFPASWGGGLRSRAAAAAAMAYRHADVLAAAGDVMGPVPLGSLSARSGPGHGNGLDSARSGGIGAASGGASAGAGDYDAYSSSASTARALSSAPAGRGRTPSPSPARVDTVRALNRSGAVGPAAAAHLKWSQSLRGDGASSGSASTHGLGSVSVDPVMMMRDVAYADALRAAVRAGYAADELMGLPLATLQSLVSDANTEAVAQAAAVEEELLHTVGARLGLPDAVTTRWVKSLADSRARAGSATSGRRPGSAGGSGSGSMTARSSSTRGGGGGDARSTAGSVASLGIAPAKDRELLLRTASASSLLARMRSGGDHPLLASPKGTASGSHSLEGRYGVGSGSSAASVSGYSAAHGLASARSLQRTGSGFGLRMGHHHHVDHDARSAAGGSVSGWTAMLHSSRGGDGGATAAAPKTPQHLRSPLASAVAGTAGARGILRTGVDAAAAAASVASVPRATAPASATNHTTSSSGSGRISGAGSTPVEVELEFERDSLRGSPPAPTSQSSFAPQAAGTAALAAPHAAVAGPTAPPTGLHVALQPAQPLPSHPHDHGRGVAAGGAARAPLAAARPQAEAAPPAAAAAPSQPHMAPAGGSPPRDKDGGGDRDRDGDAAAAAAAAVPSAPADSKSKPKTVSPPRSVTDTAAAGEGPTAKSEHGGGAGKGSADHVLSAAAERAAAPRATTRQSDSEAVTVSAAVPPLALPSAGDTEAAAFAQVKAARSQRTRDGSSGGDRSDRQRGVQVAGELGGVAASALDRLRAKASGRGAGGR